MFLLKVLIQLISIYRAGAMLIFILFYPILSNVLNSFLLVTAVLSNFIDGYLIRKFKLTTRGGSLLDLFSDKYLNCISVIFLIVEQYSLLPLLMILTKEIFVLSFRSIEIDDEFIISTNRVLGGIALGTLWLVVFLHINEIFLFHIDSIIAILGITNFIYLIYKIVTNFSKLQKVFES